MVRVRKFGQRRWISYGRNLSENVNSTLVHPQTNVNVTSNSTNVLTNQDNTSEGRPSKKKRFFFPSKKKVKLFVNV